MSVSPARRAAYHILLDIDRGSADLPGAIARSRVRLPDARDQALLHQIAVGTLRWRAAIDYLIERFAGRPIGGLDAEVLAILRLTAYQILHLTRVPVSAAVDEAVELARVARKKSAAGFVNAVLRAMVRQRTELPLPAAPGRDVKGEERTRAVLDYFSITLSHPRWLAARWLERYGEQATETWLRFNNDEAPLTLRANLLVLTVGDLAARLAQHGVATTPTRYSPYGLTVTSGNPIRTPMEAAGQFVVQDEASQMVGVMVPARPGTRVLDGCASPGGKTTEIAMRMQDRGLVVASDVRTGRVDLLRQTVRRSGARSIHVVQADLLRPPPFRPVFDAVLLDAPCSGLGTLRRDPDIKWRRREEDLPAFAAAELQMLRHAADAVRPGGILVYSTCSSEPEENEEVAAAFLAARSDFEPAAPEATQARPFVLGQPNDERPGLPLDDAGRLRTLPHVHGLEAFFAALFRRR